MKLTGKVHEIGETQQVSEKFSKRALIIEYAENPSYPEFIQLECHQDKTSMLDSLTVGDEIEAEFNLRGKPWTNKQGVTAYFNSLVLWKFTVIGKTNVPSLVPSGNNLPGDDTDLPF